jgi:hypothetical protein
MQISRYVKQGMGQEGGLGKANNEPRTTAGAGTARQEIAIFIQQPDAFEGFFETRQGAVQRVIKVFG